MVRGLKMLSLGAAVGLAIGMAAGWFPLQRRNLYPEKQDWITPEDRLRAKEVADTCDDDLPPGATILKCGVVTAQLPKRPSQKRR